MKAYALVLTIVCILISGCTDDRSEISSKPYDRGMSFAMEGNFTKAQDAFKAALNDEADKVPAQGSLRVVEKVLSKSLNKETAVYFFKGVDYANKGEPVLAYSYLSNAIKSTPDFADAYYERGIVNGRLNLFKQAVSDFTAALELNPKDTAALNNRGLSYAKGLKEYDKALADFTMAIELDPDFAEAYDNRGTAYGIGFEDKEKACADWQKACQLHRCKSLALAKQNDFCK